MVEFDKVKRLYQEHQAGINDKLVDIMSGRATTHVNAMKKIDWDAPSASQIASPYMETLVKETTTLHKVLSKHLPEMTVRMIMDPVFSSYREQWGKAFQEVDVKTEAGKERYAVIEPLTTLRSSGRKMANDTFRMLRDAELFKSRLGKLDGAADIGDHILDVVRGKAVAEPAALADSKTASTEAENPAQDGDKP